MPVIKGNNIYDTNGNIIATVKEMETRRIICGAVTSKTNA